MKSRYGYLIAGILALAIAAGLFVFFVLHKKTAPTTALPFPSGQSSASGAPNAPSGMRAYMNQKYHFSLFYPQELVQTEYKEASGGLTITFKAEDASNESFQIYITPYTGSEITPARFKLDEPSGVIDQQTAIQIASIPATMFFSTNPVMGDTREVWFIHGGYLYEVTTYKELDSWLSQIMSTWKFE